MTQKLGRLSKIGPIKFRYCALVEKSMVSCQLPLQMAEEIAFENGRISKFEGLVTLTLTLYRIIVHTIVHHSSPLCTCQIALKTKKLRGRTYSRSIFESIFCVYFKKNDPPQTVATRPKFAKASPTVGSHYSRFHPNRSTLGRVIAERVKTVFPHKSIFNIG